MNHKVKTKQKSVIDVQKNNLNIMPKTIFKGNRARGRKEQNYKNNQTIFKMAVSNTYQSITTLNVSRPSAPVKRQKMTEWLKEKGLSLCCLQEICCRPKYTQIRWKKYFMQTEAKKKNAGIAIFISDQINFTV